MASLNRMEVIGNVGRDAELRFTPSGKAVCGFSVASSHSYSGGDGERKQETQWFNIVAWNKLAETCSQYVVKGMQVYVDGRLQTKEWQGQDGEKRFQVEIVANRVIFLGKVGEPKGSLPDGEAVIPEDMPFDNDSSPNF